LGSACPIKIDPINIKPIGQYTAQLRPNGWF
jgi:hypothetical protein